MIIKNEFPPVWDEVMGAGMRPDPKNVVFTYGDTIYNPGGKDIPDHLIYHEETHSMQQRNSDEGPRQWWNRYLQDGYFRIDQEAKAYGRQYAFICQSQKDRNRRAIILNDLAGFLSGQMYGNMITRMAAREMIKKFSKI